jgi:hypothetical protein
MFETAFGAAFDHLEETRPDLVEIAGFLGISPARTKSKPKPKKKTERKTNPKAEPAPTPVVLEAEIIDLENEGGVWK